VAAAVALALAACGPEPVPASPAAPPLAPSASQAGEPAASAAAPPAAPDSPPPAPPPPCSELVKSLPFGDTLDDRSPGVAPGGDAPLTELFPGAKAEGFQVELAVAVQLGADPSARALILRRPPEEGQSPLQPRPAWLGLAGCTASKGYALLAAPSALLEASSVVVWDTERVTLPGGAQGTSLTVAMGGIALEFYAAAYLLGESTAALPTDAPKGEKAGVLAVFGPVSQQFLVPGDEERYARADRLDGTGYYPLDDGQAFVSLNIEDSVARGKVLGWLDARGARRNDRPSRPTYWAAVGKGDLPAFCSAKGAAGKIRCSKLGLRPALGTLSHDWIAGIWPSPAAAEAALKDAGADGHKLDFLAMDDDEAHPPRGPGGKTALAVLKAKPPKTAPRTAPPKRGKR
jgi:hypothetical protein